MEPAVLDGFVERLRSRTGDPSKATFPGLVRAAEAFPDQRELAEPQGDTGSERTIETKAPDGEASIGQNAPHLSSFSDGVPSMELGRGVERTRL